MKLAYPNIESRAAMSAFPSQSMDVICAYEVMEHLSDGHTQSFIDEARRVCKPGGHVIVSVPIMQGLALPIKEASRSILFRRRSDYSFKELAIGLFGGNVVRAENILTSHKGFDHRQLRRTLERHFQLLSMTKSPIPFLPWWLSSQVFLIFSQQSGK